jgi:hypothetical protein
MNQSMLGCGVNFDEPQIFFTKNGQLMGGIPLLCSVKVLAPTLGKCSQK